MKEISFQNIFNVLQELINIDWQKIVFYASYSEGSYSMKFYVKDNNGAFVDCFSLNGTNEKQIVKGFMNINKELEFSRNNAGNEQWNLLTLVVTNSGDFKADYEYGVDDYMISHQDEWKKRYTLEYLEID